MAAQRALRLSPRDPFSAVYNGIAAYAQFIGRDYEKAIAASRARPSASAPILSAPTGC